MSMAVKQHTIYFTNSDTHFGFPQFLTVINNTTMNIFVYPLFPSPNVSLDEIPKVILSGKRNI